MVRRPSTDIYSVHVPYGGITENTFPYCSCVILGTVSCHGCWVRFRRVQHRLSMFFQRWQYSLRIEKEKVHWTARLSCAVDCAVLVYRPEQLCLQWRFLAWSKNCKTVSRCLWYTYNLRHAMSVPTCITIYPGQMFCYVYLASYAAIERNLWVNTWFRFVQCNLTWPSWTWRKREWALSNWKTKELQKTTIQMLYVLNTTIIAS